MNILSVLNQRPTIRSSRRSSKFSQKSSKKKQLKEVSPFVHKTKKLRQIISRCSTRGPVKDSGSIRSGIELVRRSKTEALPALILPQSHVNIQFRETDRLRLGDFRRTTSSSPRSFLSPSVELGRRRPSRILRVCSKRMSWSCSGIQRLMRM